MFVRHSSYVFAPEAVNKQKRCKGHDAFIPWLLVQKDALKRAYRVYTFVAIVTWVEIQLALIDIYSMKVESNV